MTNRYEMRLGDGTELWFSKRYYLHDCSLAVVCNSNYGPYGRVTVNLNYDDDLRLAKNCAFVDSNNFPQEIIEMLVADKMMRPLGIFKKSGFCEYELYEFSDEFLDGCE